ncbi:Dysbindin [Trichoplax sp. H2]|nr:Dysbindin [Trichoplax sp. H2]|eukprot:RDD47035.1 Dysbindin [Trichoplax sp. H2]
MASLTSIKDRLFSNVQHGLSDGLKSVGKLISSSTTKSFLGSDNVDSSESTELGLHAGAETLDRYQRNWADIHKATNACSENATAADREIMKLKGQIDDFYNSYKVLHMELAGLSSTIASVEASRKSTEEMADKVIEIEQMLEELEFVNKRIDFENLKQRHRNQFEKYKESKELEYIRLQKSLEHQRAHKEELQEGQERKKLLDRQKTFEEEFKRELNLFKTKGHLERPLSQTSSTSSSKLEDIVVDSDENTQMLLDEFLGLEDKIDDNEVNERSLCDNAEETNSDLDNPQHNLAETEEIINDKQSSDEGSQAKE